LQGFLNYF